MSGFGGLTKQKALTSLFSLLKPEMILLRETMCDYVTVLSLFTKIKPGWEFCALDFHGLSWSFLDGIHTSPDVKLSSPMQAFLSKLV